MAQKKPFILYKRKSKRTGGKEIYYAIFRGENGERLPAESTGETNKNAAEAWAINIYKAKKYLKTMTLAEFAANFFTWGKCQWIARQHAQGRTFGHQVAKMRRAHLDRYILPVFGIMRLGDIKAARISDFLLKLEQTIKKKDGTVIKKPLTNQSKNHLLNSFRIIMEEAVFRELVEFNPVKNVRRFADDHKQRDIFTGEELRRLFPADRAALFEIWQGPYWSTFFFTLLTSGIRLGEARALLWANIDWSIPALTVTQAMKADNTIGMPKNKGQRAVYLPSRTVAMLEDWKQASRFTSMNDFVFHGIDGQRPIHQHTALDYFRKGLKQAKIDVTGRVIVIHSFRHQYNTIMRQAISETALRFMVGHSDVKMTDNYDQAGPLDKLRAFLPELDKINKAWT